MILLLIATAVLILAAIYVGHQGFRLQRINKLLKQVVKDLREHGFDRRG